MCVRSLYMHLLDILLAACMDDKQNIPVLVCVRQRGRRGGRAMCRVFRARWVHAKRAGSVTQGFFARRSAGCRVRSITSESGCVLRLRVSLLCSRRQALTHAITVRVREAACLGKHHLRVERARINSLRKRKNILMCIALTFGRILCYPRKMKAVLAARDRS